MSVDHEFPAGKKKHKILFLVTEDWYFVSHRLPIACAARAAGFDVIVATRVQDHGERIAREGLKLVPVCLRRTSQSPRKEIRSFSELVKLYKAERPDIVHHVAMKPVLYGSLAARIAKVPITVNALGGLGYVFTDRRRQKILRMAISRALKFSLNGPNSKTIIQNPDDIELLVSSNLVRRENVILIKGSGVDTTEFAAASEMEGKPIVALVSRMLWDKGVKEFVDAATLLQKKGTAARFVLIGKSDPDNPASISSSTLQTWHDQGIVEWWGHQNDIPFMLKRAHVICLPSYREGMPKVLLEAAACGRPIVTTDTPGCRDVVKDGVNGYLVPARDAVALACAIGKLIQDAALRAEMGRRGREMAVREFSVEKVVSATLALYRKLLDVSKT